MAERKKKGIHNQKNSKYSKYSEQGEVEVAWEEKVEAILEIVMNTTGSVKSKQESPKTAQKGELKKKVRRENFDILEIVGSHSSLSLKDKKELSGYPSLSFFRSYSTM